MTDDTPGKTGEAGLPLAQQLGRIALTLDDAVQELVQITTLLASAGEPVLEPEPEPAPAAPEAPAPAPARHFEILPHDPTGWQPGQVVAIPVRLEGWEAVLAVACRGDKTSSWVGNPQRVAIQGLGSVAFTVPEAGAFLKIWPEGRVDLHDDSLPAPAPAPAPSPAPPPAEVSGDYHQALAFRARMGMGLNYERMCGAGLPIGVLRQARADGVGHGRLFCPSRATSGFVGANALELFFDSIAAASSIGMPIVWDMLDYCYAQDLNHPGTLPYLKRALAGFRARQFNPALVALGAVNEYAVTNTQAIAFRETVLPLIASSCPGFVIVDKGGEWSNPPGLLDSAIPLPLLKARLFEWHLYDNAAHNEAVAIQIGARLRRWGEDNQRVVTCGEWGVGPPTGEGEPGNRKHIPAAIRAASRGFGDMSPAIWTATHGDWWRCNGEDTLNLSPTVAAAFLEATAYLGSQADYRAP